MQRILLLLVGFAPAALWGQQGAGAELWRVAATTLPLPPALSTSGAAAFWNPAQPAIPERASLAFEVIETAPTVGASGVIATVRVRVRPLGQVGLVYGRMGIGDLVRTSLSPDPDPGTIPYYTQTLGATWGTRRGRYGIATAHGFSADYQFGAGFELGPQFGCDLVVEREGSYGQAGWRAVTGVRVAVGRYRVSFARDFGVNDIGAAYRVGLEGRVP